MSAGLRAGAPAGSSAASSSFISIPANARKVVQDLKEIVKNSDDEIYAMLKECNMDPNETVQRLLNQDTFHEVKRKRDKKKENANKELGESRTRAPGISSSMRGGRPRPRGNYTPRYNSEFSSGGRGQPFGGRDNGTQQNGRISNIVANPGVPAELQAPTKPAAFNTSESAPAISSATSGLPNGSSQYTRVVQGTRGGLGPGQATMADILKSSNAIHANAASAPLKVASQQPLYPPDGALSSAGDQVLNPYADSHTSVTLGSKQNLGMVGHERSVRDISPSLPVEPSSATEPSEQASQLCQPSTYRLDAFSSVSDGNAVETDIPSTSIPSSLPQELLSSLEVSSEGQTIQSSSGSPELPGPRASLMASQYNGRMVYQAQSQTLGSEKGSGMEWRPKSPVKPAVPFKLFNEATSRSAPSQDNMELFLNSTSKLQQLSIHEDQPVIIPDHLQVPEAERTHLSFGSFGEDFETSSNFVDDEEEDDKKSTASVEDNLHDEEATVEQPSAPSLVNAAAVPIADSYNKQPLSSPMEPLGSREDVKINMPAPVIMAVSQPEVPKPETLVQQSAQHPILSAMHNYTGTGAVPQLMSGQFTYDTPESQTQEVSRAPSFMSYSDPGATANYYNPVFRPSSDLDARYAQFVSASTNNKYTAGIPQMTGQGLSSSQEGANSIVLPASGPAGQTSQTVGLAQGTLTIPQQHIPIHAYPSQHAGVPLTPFGANVFGIHYVPPSYGYMHSPYQHSYAGNTGLPQAPGTFFAPGSSYGAAYTSTGAAAMKYALPQYKPGGAAGSAPHAAVAAGYGNFGTSPSGFTTMNSAVTSAAGSGYEDSSGAQYKENNLFIPSQQPAEGSGVWIQNPPSRDMTGMQTNSYYNLLGQGQHTSFAHTQPMHAVPAAAYASLYHQSQSGSAPAVHQLLQQPQALGAVGGVGNQSGAYQQQQRQLSWPPSY